MTTSTSTEQHRAALRRHARAARIFGQRAANRPTLAGRQSARRFRARHLAAVAAIREEMSA